MTKARARQRAKAKAAGKSKKRDANTDPSAQQTRPGHFDPKSQSIKSPGTNFSANSFGGARRGAARSK